jgi:hypothetical protein
MRIIYACLLICSLSCFIDWTVCYSAEPPQELPEKIRIPSLPVQATPIMRSPAVVTPAEWYVVESDVELIVKTIPVGIVKIEKIKNDGKPVILLGKFFGGAEDETRIYNGPHIYRVKAVKEGRADLLFIPVGVKTEIDIKQVTIQTNVLPQPGPQPNPNPPIPMPSISPIKADGLHVLIVYDAKAVLTAEQSAVIYSEFTRKLLAEKCVTDAKGLKAFRILPSNVNFGDELTVWQDAFKRERKVTPWLVMGNGKEGYEGPLPANVGDFEKLVNKYTN